MACDDIANRKTGENARENMLRYANSQGPAFLMMDGSANASHAKVSKIKRHVYSAENPSTLTAELTMHATYRRTTHTTPKSG